MESERNFSSNDSQLSSGLTVFCLLSNVIWVNPWVCSFLRAWRVKFSSFLSYLVVRVSHRSNARAISMLKSLNRFWIKYQLNPVPSSFLAVKTSCPVPIHVEGAFALTNALSRKICSVGLSKSQAFLLFFMDVDFVFQKPLSLNVQDILLLFDSCIKGKGKKSAWTTSEKVLERFKFTVSSSSWEI